jgi:hypothetical protein
MSHPLHGRFLLVLPRIEAHAKIYFREVRCPGGNVDFPLRGNQVFHRRGPRGNVSSSGAGA